MTQPNNQGIQDQAKRPEFDLLHAMVKHRIQKIFGIMANKFIHLNELEPDPRTGRVYLDVARVIRETIREEVGSDGSDIGDGAEIGRDQGQESS